MSIHNKIKEARHVWAFGCSFTSYSWKTWADIIRDKYGKLSNCGKIGAGNQFIFHRIMEEYTNGQIHKDDLIMICWSGHYRKDNKFKSKWYTPGNILNQDYWPKDFAEDYCDPEFFLERDLYFAFVINEIFKDRVINFSMADIQIVDQCTSDTLGYGIAFGNDMIMGSVGAGLSVDPSKNRIQKTIENAKISEMLDKFYPSFYRVLWDNNVENIKHRKDKHPTEDEHRLYLKKVFDI